jgi:hypothetical protein
VNIAKLPGTSAEDDPPIIHTPAPSHFPRQGGYCWSFYGGLKWNQQKSRRRFLLGVVPNAVRKCYFEFPAIGRVIFCERMSVRGVRTRRARSSGLRFLRQSQWPEQTTGTNKSY